MSTLDTIKARAKEKQRKVVLPEGSDPRTIEAAKIIVDDNMAEVDILGSESEVAPLAKESGLDLGRVSLVDPTKSDQFERYVEDFCELRKAKKITPEQARALIAQPLYYGAMMVRHDQADASVAGAVNTTGDVLRAAIHVLGLAKGINTVSSCFMMTVPEYRGEKDKVYLYADGAVVPNPTAEQLASIAVSTAQTMVNLLGMDPKVAMLSFSTKGSAKHPDVDKVLAALDILKKDHPELAVDGELQVDAAIVPEVAAKKAPGSVINGEANVLIFPDLDAGNIAYKLTQRLARATATGPIIQGLAKPANDLSRGCSAQDIVDVAAIAILMKG